MSKTIKTFSCYAFLEDRSTDERWWIQVNIQSKSTFEAAHKFIFHHIHGRGFTRYNIVKMTIERNLI